MTNRALTTCQPEQPLTVSGRSYQLRHESQPVYRWDVEGRTKGELVGWQHTGRRTRVGGWCGN